MKKITIFVLICFTVMMFTACGITGKEILHLESNEWKMDAVMSNDISLADSDAVVAAVGAPDALYPNAKVVDLTLTAKGGELTLVDATNHQTYTGTYIITEETSKSITYEIVIDGITGSATLSWGEQYEGDSVPTLPINLGAYSVYFLPHETDTK